MISPFILRLFSETKPELTTALVPPTWYKELKGREAYSLPYGLQALCHGSTLPCLSSLVQACAHLPRLEIAVDSR